MFRGSLLLFCLLVSSLIATTSIHAQEALYASGVECAEAGYSESDENQSSNDMEKAVPHQHGGCHGHHISIAANAAASDTLVRDGDLLLPRDAVGLEHSGIDPALRPPIA